MLYEYRCQDCKEVTEAFRSVEDRDNCPECHCGGETNKIISAYRVHSDFAPYFDANLDTFIQSKQHRRKVMKEQGLSEHFGQNWHTSSVKSRQRQ